MKIECAYDLLATIHRRGPKYTSERMTCEAVLRDSIRLTDAEVWYQFDAEAAMEAVDGWERCLPGTRDNVIGLCESAMDFACTPATQKGGA